MPIYSTLNRNNTILQPFDLGVIWINSKIKFVTIERTVETQVKRINSVPMLARVLVLRHTPERLLLLVIRHAQLLPQLADTARRTHL